MSTDSQRVLLSSSALNEVIKYKVVHRKHLIINQRLLSFLQIWI